MMTFDDMVRALEQVHTYDEYLVLVHEISVQFIHGSKTTDELKEVGRHLFGKNGIWTEILKQYGRAMKELHSEKD